MTVKMGEIMDNIKTGSFGKILLKNHIVLCGFTRACEIVIDDLLKDEEDFNNIVLITLNDDPNISGVIYYHGDFSEERTLMEVNLQDAKTCIVFAEPRNGEDKRTTDLRTVLTVFNIETEFDVHTISEINYRENAKIIADKINGDELIFKEIIDAHLISTCVKFPAISTLIYDLLNSEGKKLEKIQLSDIQLESGTSMKAVKHSCIDKDWTVLGIERSKSIPELSPSNDIVLDKDDKIIVIA
jgi:voltage-gated potassium channel